jgi:glutaredoxin 2
MGNIMFKSAQQESPFEVDDRYVSQLAAQISHLRELIVVMVDQNKDTRRQSELLFAMLRELKAAKLMRALGARPADAQADHARAAVAACRARLDA